MSSKQKPVGGHILFVSLLLLVIFISRIVIIRTVEFDEDEVWTIWQTFGTPGQIIQWTPRDWSPAFFLVLGGWKELVGIHPIILRTLPLLVFMLGSAFAYQIAFQFTGQRSTGALGMLAYAAPAYMLYHSLQIRGYIFVLALLPAMLWITIIYFKHSGWRWGILLGMLMAAMFYSALPAVFAFMVPWVYTILVHPRRLWRWWLPGTVALGGALPLVISKWQQASSTAMAGLTQAPFAAASPLNGFIEATRFFAGRGDFLWAGLLIVALFLTVWRGRPLRKETLVIWFWYLGGTFIMYLLNPFLNYFVPRHASWLMIGMALTVAIGMASLPRRGQWAAALLLVGLSFMPLDTTPYEGLPTQLETSFTWLAKHLQAKDVMIIDPVLVDDEARPQIRMMLDYYERVFFPQGLIYVDEPGDHRRIWFFSISGRATPELLERISQGRIAREFVGPWNALIRLYEAPPDPEGILFANGLRLHGVAIVRRDDREITGNAVFREQEAVRVRLWWSVDHPLDKDYSYNTLLLNDEGIVVSEVNGPPQPVQLDPNGPREIPAETSRWEPGQLYVEERLLTVPEQSGALLLGLVMYQWWDGTLISAPGVGKNGVLPLKTIFVMAW